MIATRIPVTGRSAWRPADFAGPEAYSVTLTPAQRASLDRALNVAGADRRPPEEINNCTMLHNRTAFEDGSDPARKRHLLRLWLMLDGRRPLAPAVHAY